MKFAILQPHYRKQRGEPADFSVTFETLALLEAPTAQDALVRAKRLGYLCPIIGPAQDTVQ